MLLIPRLALFYADDDWDLINRKPIAIVKDSHLKTLSIPHFQL
jgi:hypothetical protein